MKLQLLESKTIPKYATVSFNPGELVLKVKSIELSLILVKTQHGYQWAIKNIAYQETLRDRKYREGCLMRLWEYFD